MLEEFKAKLLLTQEHLRDGIRFAGEVIDLDDAR